MHTHTHTHRNLSPFPREQYDLVTRPVECSCPERFYPQSHRGGEGQAAEFISHCSCLTTSDCMAGGLHINAGKTGHKFPRATSFRPATSASVSINHSPETAGGKAQGQGSRGPSWGWIPHQQSAASTQGVRRGFQGCLGWSESGKDNSGRQRAGCRVQRSRPPHRK